MDQISITAPDDMHCHLRDGDSLTYTVPDVAARFKKALIMPNLIPSVTTVVAAKHYRERIVQHVPENRDFTPLMTLYLTQDLPPAVINEAKACGFIHAVKLYPAGVTTHSAAGVSDLNRIYPVLEAMQEHELILCIHGESIEPQVDIFDREHRFIEKELTKIIKTFPKLRIVLEHISTKAAVQFVESAPENVAATITAHHLLFQRNDIFKGGIRPHYYCLPILKRYEDQEALIAAATSGNPKFFLGTDSAPHAKSKKESACGCAGIYTMHAAIELYAHVFAKANALGKLDSFASHYGARFYGLPINKEKITLIKKSWEIPASLNYNDDVLIPAMAGQSLDWQLQETI